MAGVHNHRQMAELFHRGNRAQIQRVAGVIFKRTDAAFAKNYVFIAACQNVFRAHHPFFNRGGQPAFEQDRLSGFAQFAQ